MEDFNALAAAVAAGLDDVRGCLILSRDGLVLGAYPALGEEAAKPAWLRLAGIGEFERGFLQFGTEVWCYVRRGPYAAFALAGQGVRPGLVIDQMEQALLTAEETRSRREGMRGAEAPMVAAPSGKPRSPLHAEPKPEERHVVIPADAAVWSGSPGPGSTVEGAAAAEATRDGSPPSESGVAAPEEAEEPGGEEVDRFTLAREFSQLLQDEGSGADG